MRVKFDLRNKLSIFFFYLWSSPMLALQPQPIWAGLKAGLR